MKILTSAFVTALALAALSTPALAAAPVIAKLQAPIAAPTKVIAGGAIFSCAGDTCVATNPSNATGDFSSCKIVAHAVGAVVSFGTAADPLAADRIAACNESAKK